MTQTSGIEVISIAQRGARLSQPFTMIDLIQVDDLMLSIFRYCSRCPALAVNRRQIVHGYGAPDARILFVGEAPGYKGADVTGVPFTRDRSGVRFQQMLIALGLSAETDPRVERPRLTCFVTNVVRCNPPANRAPSREEIANCLPYLWEELAVVQPEIVAPIGRVAAQELFMYLLGRPAPPTSQAHAQVFPIPEKHRYFAGMARPRILLPMRHPSRISNAELERFIAAMRLEC
ncbi:MAG: uracil-DNA glycosylase [Anaerolineae bacterium]|nr:uracil-DNA glycosylase [Anaerolineae bacterium]